jgi:hypothetical protein
LHAILAERQRRQRKEKTMKELSGTARNYYLAENDNGFVPMVELVLILSEPQWHFGAGDLVRERIPETFRVAMTRGSVKELMRNLLEVDEELVLLDKKAAAANRKGIGQNSTQQAPARNGGQEDEQKPATSCDPEAQ